MVRVSEVLAVMAERRNAPPASRNRLYMLLCINCGRTAGSCSTEIAAIGLHCCTHCYHRRVM